jgi:alcohol dehydrogenase class IV
MDALCQLIESYTSRKANAVSDALAGCGIPRAASALPRVWRDATDLSAREDMALAALLSGITLTNVGLGAVHGFAAPMGANYPIPHGTVCALLLPHVFQANARALQAESADHPALRRFESVGRWVTGDEQVDGSEAIAAGIDRLKQLVVDLQIPLLREFGVRVEDFAGLVALAKRSSSMRYNPLTLDDQTLTEILQAAW